jgi:Pvc16 N-terminal domain
MANYKSLSAAGTSIEQLLNSCFASVPEGDFTRPPKAVLARTEDFDINKKTGVVKPGILTIFMYRVEFNKTMRSAWSGIGSFDGYAHLPLDLHFLITAWEDHPEGELRMLGRAMQCLETTPILSGPLLAPSGEWAPAEGVQLVLEDVPPDSMFRIFDSLQADFKLSVAYIARVVVVDGVASNLAPAVTTVISGSTPTVLARP